MSDGLTKMYYSELKKKNLKENASSLTAECSNGSVTITENGSDLDISEMCDMFQRLLLGMGYVFDGTVGIIEEEEI